MKQSSGFDSVLEVLSYTVERTADLAKANSVMGEPYEKSGITVIPVSKISVGFAGGGGDIPSQKNVSESAGAGSKVTVTPITFLVIDKDGAHTLEIPVGNAEKPSPITDAAQSLISFIKERTTKKNNKNPDRPR